MDTSSASFIFDWVAVGSIATGILAVATFITVFVALRQQKETRRIQAGSFESGRLREQNDRLRSLMFDCFEFSLPVKLSSFSKYPEQEHISLSDLDRIESNLIELKVHYLLTTNEILLILTDNLSHEVDDGAGKKYYSLIEKLNNGYSDTIDKLMELMKVVYYLKSSQDISLLLQHGETQHLPEEFYTTIAGSDTDRKAAIALCIDKWRNVMNGYISYEKEVTEERHLLVVTADVLNVRSERAKKAALV